MAFDDVDDDGLIMRSIEIGRLVAEGGFGYVYEAFPLASEDDNHNAGNPDDDNDNDDEKKYALKRINCAGNRELIASCRREIDANKRLTKSAKNSRGQGRYHPNLLALLSVKFVNDGDRDQNNTEEGDVELGGLLSGSRSNDIVACYMLFPFITHSLRGEITERNIVMSPNEYNNYNGQSNHARRRKPFSTIEVLQLFGGILDGLIAVHAVNLSHRDIKIENIMLRRRMRGHHLPTPVLVDLGSAGPLTVDLSQGGGGGGGGRDTQSRRRALNSIVEDAASHTTMAYRPPELFEGGMMMTSTKKNEEEILDFGLVDVWSLGCVLFGLMHGASPFEIEFFRTTSDGQYGHVRIVECTRLKILGEVSLPPWTNETLQSQLAIGSNDQRGTNGKYPMSVYELVLCLVNHDHKTRPSLHEVTVSFNELYLQVLGEQWTSYSDIDQVYWEKGQY